VFIVTLQLHNLLVSNGINEGESPVCFMVSWNKFIDHRLDILRATKGAHIEVY